MFRHQVELARIPDSQVLGCMNTINPENVFYTFLKGPPWHSLEILAFSSCFQTCISTLLYHAENLDMTHFCLSLYKLVDISKLFLNMDNITKDVRGGRKGCLHLSRTNSLQSPQPPPCKSPSCRPQHLVLSHMYVLSFFLHHFLSLP